MIDINKNAKKEKNKNMNIHLNVKMEMERSRELVTQGHSTSAEKKRPTPAMNRSSGKHVERSMAS